jgi:hypothetical protein
MACCALVACAASGGLTALLMLPTQAAASCVPLKPREELPRSAAAFIGRPVESSDDRVTYQVIESVKGQLGDRVEVRDEAPGTTSIGDLPRTPGEVVALFLRADAGGGFSSNGCLSTSPEGMRAAAASRRTRCLAPRVLEVTVRRQRGHVVEVRVQARDRDDAIDRLEVDWGDGAVARVRVHGGVVGRAKSAVLRRRYRRTGSYTVRAVARSRTTVDCTFRGLGPREELSMPRATLIRIR